MSLADSFIKNTKKIKGAGQFSKVLEEPKEYHDTGVYALNLAFSGDIHKGPSDGVSCIAGKSKSFKTLFGLMSCKAYLDANPDAYMIFYDSEGGASQSYFESVGIDVDRVIYIPIMNIEELKFDIMEKLEAIKNSYKETKEYEKFVFFVDSIGNLASIKEVTDSLSGNSASDMGTRAKSLKALFRIITPYFTNYKMHFIAIMHTYDEMAAMGAPKQIMSGGCLLPGTNVITEHGLKHIEDINIGDKVISSDGNLTTVVNTWNPETLLEGYTDCLEIEFEDGHKVSCTKNHMFLVDGKWVKSEDLSEGMDVESL